MHNPIFLTNLWFLFRAWLLICGVYVLTCGAWMLIVESRLLIYVAWGWKWGVCVLICDTWVLICDYLMLICDGWRLICSNWILIWGICVLNCTWWLIRHALMLICVAWVVINYVLLKVYPLIIRRPINCAGYIIVFLTMVLPIIKTCGFWDSEYFILHSCMWPLERRTA